MSNGLGSILVGHGVITDAQLAEVERHRATSGAPLARAIVDLGLATDVDIIRALAERLGMPYLDVSAASVDHDAARLLSREVALELTALPVAFDGSDGLVVAVADPSNRAAQLRVAEETGLRITLGLAPRRALTEAIAHLTEPGAPAGPAGPPAASAAPGSGPGAPAAGAPATGAAHDATLLGSEIEPAIDLDALLVTLVESGGSDLHLTVGIPPTIRVNGDLQQLPDFPVLESDDLRSMLYAIMTQKQREQFENTLELDMSYSVPGQARFRVNIFQQRDAMGAVMRVIPFEIIPLDKLGIPSQVSNFAYLPRGFVLVTGPTGSGKSTTLASLLDLVNENRPAHIMTVEDPIEFLHKHKRSVVNQREVGTDTYTFSAALKHVLRQDPDVILVGELRDLETIQIALTAAETGHLVFGTLHTQDAPQTVDRLIDVFPPHQQEQIRVQLAGALQGVVCQTLLKTADGRGRTVATEILTATPAIRNLIREGKTHQIYSSIQAGAKHGMVAMDQSLATLVKRGAVTYDAALEKCQNVTEFNRLVGRSPADK